MAVAPLPSREAESRVLAAYERALGRIQHEAAQLAKQQERAVRNGDPISPAWLYRQRRYRDLEATTLREINRLSTVVERETRRAQAQVIPIGAAAALRSVARYAPSRQARAAVEQRWGQFNPSAVEQLVGNTGDGKPLGWLLSTFGPKARNDVTHALVVGIVTGKSPRQTAPIVANALGSTSARALTITRTETLRAYRAASLDSMSQSSVVDGWTWVAACDATTCPMCWDMNGTEHSMDESLDSHPSCRCTAVPKTISWSSLGINAPDTSPYIESGADKFARAPLHVQAAVLGPGGHALYRQGVPLSSFSRPTYSAYGKGLARVPNRDLRPPARLAIPNS